MNKYDRTLITSVPSVLDPEGVAYSSLTSDPNVFAAGLQIAVWELIYNPFCYETDSAGLREIANELYKEATSQSDTAIWLVEAPGSGGQDMFMAVPEPGAAVLATIGLAGAFGYFYYRRPTR